MKTFVLIFSFLLLANFSYSQEKKLIPSEQVCFTPGENCTEEVVQEIAKAKQEILVQAYSFTSVPIAKALSEAFVRRVKVSVVLDRSQENGKGSEAEFLAGAGIPVYIDSAHAIAHNKVIIIDESVLITGSFNFTKAAQDRNAENLLVLHSPTLAMSYLKNWKIHRGHSEEYN